MKTFLLLGVLLISVASFGQNPDYNYLVWADEFDGNGAIDSEKWHHQTQLPNGGSWYNNEIQHYTNRVVNAQVSNGTLKIIAKKEVFTDQGVTKQYTSARLNSKFAFTNGKVEVRAKLPTGVGTWPAIWTLGKNIIEAGGFWSDTHGTVIWPACGEFDIMEHWGSNQDYISSAIHTPSSYGNTMNVGGRVLAGASNAFHTYTMEWYPEKAVFSVDGTIHYTYEPAVQNSDTWPFNADQYMLLNVAILPNIDPSYTESAMEIDYVRIYQETPLGIDDRAFGDALIAHPNPVSDTLDVSVSKNVVNGKIQMYSLLGELMHTFEITNTTNQIDMSSYQDGIYFLKLSSETGVTIKKIIKQSN